MAPRADEWVCDGGDQQVHVRLRDDGSAQGLDPQDTVAYYRTRDGQPHVTASNRVCIYAPRFAAVRKITSIDVAGDALQVRTANQPLETDLAAQPLGSLAVQRRQPTLGHSQLGVPTPLRDRRPGRELMNRQPMHEFETALAPYEDFQLIRTGTLSSVELVRLLKAVDAAISWTDNAAVQVVLGRDVPTVARRAEPVGEIFQAVQEGLPELRIVKLASSGEAQPGEMVEFTLRVDNVGDWEATDVTIIDNLSPRLEYIPESAQCSVNANFSLEPNQVGSVSLRWDLQQPLPAQQGLVLRFRCQVR